MKININLNHKQALKVVMDIPDDEIEEARINLKLRSNFETLEAFSLAADRLYTELRQKYRYPAVSYFMTQTCFETDIPNKMDLLAKLSRDLEAKSQNQAVSMIKTVFGFLAKQIDEDTFITDIVASKGLPANENKSRKE